MPPKPRWNTITISLPEDFFHVSKTGKIKIMQPLTDKGNIKTVDKKKSVILTTAPIPQPTISGGMYQTQEEVNASGGTTRTTRKNLGTAKEEATKRKLRKEQGTKKRMIDTFIRQDFEDFEKNLDGETMRHTPHRDKAVVVSNIKKFHENKKNAKESMNEKMARLRALRGKPKN